MTALTDAEIDALDGEALRVAVAIQVIGWKTSTLSNYLTQLIMPTENRLRGLPAYESDANAVREVEAEIERRDKSSDFDYGLLSSYCGYLCEYTMGEGVWGHQDIDVRIFAMITASPAARCRAALKAVRG